MKAGTLLMTCYLPKRDGYPRDYAVLRVTGEPPTASIGAMPVVTGDIDMDLGDYEVAPVPAQPAAEGLWVLEWPWTMVPHPDENPMDDGEALETARYGDGVWRRLTPEEANALTRREG